MVDHYLLLDWWFGHCLLLVDGLEGIWGRVDCCHNRWPPLSSLEHCQVSLSNFVISRWRWLLLYQPQKLGKFFILQALISSLKIIASHFVTLIMEERNHWHNARRYSAITLNVTNDSSNFLWSIRKSHVAWLLQLLMICIENGIECWSIRGIPKWCCITLLEVGHVSGFGSFDSIEALISTARDYINRAPLPHI